MEIDRQTTTQCVLHRTFIPPWWPLMRSLCPKKVCAACFALCKKIIKTNLRIGLLWLWKPSFPPLRIGPRRPPVPPGSKGGHRRLGEWRILHWAIQSANFLYKTSVWTQALVRFFIKTERAVHSAFPAKIEHLYPIFSHSFLPAVPFKAPDGRHLVHLRCDVTIIAEDSPYCSVKWRHMWVFS